MNKKHTSDRTFIDQANVIIKGGKGGDGCMSFRREKYVPKGGPNGGDGGDGGHVFFQASRELKTLLDFSRKPVYQAETGEAGRGRKQYGKKGNDLLLRVPCGTVILDDDQILADLILDGDKVRICKGGKGGKGNVHFKSSTRQAPRIAERGEPGETRKIHLQLKVIADVGLIGFPNAGKSTLLSRLTRANPKVANYPFTTLSPNLGVAQYHNREIVFADIPGLIEGSHQGRGLGYEFLQHVERTRVLVHIVDPMGYENKLPKENIKIIREEMKKYSKDLAKKPEVLVINKQDLTGADEVFKEIKKAYRRKKVVAMSGVSGQGVKDLLAAITLTLDELPPDVKSPDIEPVHIALEPEFKIEKTEECYIVRGKKVERLVAMTNFGLPEAVQRTQHILKKMGIERSLLARGAKKGDQILIGDNEFTFEPDLVI